MKEALLAKLTTLKNYFSQQRADVLLATYDFKNKEVRQKCSCKLNSNSNYCRIIHWKHNYVKSQSYDY